MDCELYNLPYQKFSLYTTRQNFWTTPRPFSGKRVKTLRTISQHYIIRIDRSTMDFSKNGAIDVLNWHSRSVDIKIMENAWSMLSNLTHDGTQPRKVEQ